MSLPAATEVLGFPYTNLDYEGVVNQTDVWISRGSHAYVIAAPVSSLMMAKRSADIERAFRDGDLMTADGVPIVWAQRMLGHPGATRVYGPTLMLRVLERAAEKGWNVGLYGGHPDRLDPLAARLLARYPRLRITYKYSPPFRTLTDLEKQTVVAQLRASKVQALFVGLGAPKQERWMQEFSPKVSAVMFGVGAAFDFHAGYLPQAPPLMQRMGLEWLFRLASEPKRLWKRYATTIPPFLFLIAREIVTARVTGRSHQIVDEPKTGGAGPTSIARSGKEGPTSTQPVG